MNPHLAEGRRCQADYGWAVFPVRDKKPLPGSHGHRDATTDPAVLARLFRRYPDANGVAVACSSETGPIVVDCDGPDGADALRELERRFGPLPATRAASSGRPHRFHLYFAPPAGGQRVRRRSRSSRAWTSSGTAAGRHPWRHRVRGLYGLARAIGGASADVGSRGPRPRHHPLGGRHDEE